MVSDRSPIGSDAAAQARRWADAVASRAPRPVADLVPLVATVAGRLSGGWLLDAGARAIAAGLPARAAERVGELVGALAAGFAQGLNGGDHRRSRPAVDSRIGLWICDPDGTVADANQAFADLVGRPLAQIIGRPLCLSDAEWETVAQVAEGTVDHLRAHRTWRRPDGTQVRADVLVLRGGATAGGKARVVGLVERADGRTRPTLLTDHDALTGVLDRAALFDALAADPDTLIGLCYLDLDGFKAVNDTLGNEGGDIVLRAVARRLDDELARDGHVVARTGGDEFAVLVHGATGDPERDLDELQRVAHRVLAIVRRPVRIGGHRIAVTASAGVVRRDPGRRQGAELMRAASTTLSRAKKAGRDRVAVFDPDLHHRDVSRFAMTARMPQALADGEFSLEYQPLVRLADGTLVGVEALARWTLPNGERVSPDRFVPLAEETGMIVPLGRWVLAEACRQSAEWLRAGVPPLLMSVNLAAKQVDDSGLVDAVTRALTENGLPPQTLQLELTESEVMDPSTGTRATLEALAGFGVRLAIDDFGTGYSNLAYLRSLPVHALKLAGPFVTGALNPAGDSSVDVEITSMLVGLAHALGLTVTAESVETPEQAAQLLELGCDLGQGWLYSPAVGPGEVPGLVGRPLGVS
ncbi:diguanylate cyclase (GGDEF) domain-containing protein [Pseudonocardia thermophila]|uniref:Diguanylate cyclase (GGDEF) domain-containing protein n=1 Tax=Pseudonocardia thermophila TaxID=1848 RepID=A0A1M6NMK7_PSETH|nr:diguanylate cyclase (GGDEF) domain-containing protein [Pseudonocardia thermophila]